MDWMGWPLAVRRRRPCQTRNLAITIWQKCFSKLLQFDTEAVTCEFTPVHLIADSTHHLREHESAENSRKALKYLAGYVRLELPPRFLLAWFRNPRRYPHQRQRQKQ